MSSSVFPTDSQGANLKPEQNPSPFWWNLQLLDNKILPSLWDHFNDEPKTSKSLKINSKIMILVSDFVYLLVGHADLW